MENKIEFDLNTMGYMDIESMHIVIKAYRDLDSNEYIMDGGTGFNTNSGYVYIALENGISIASCFGQSVDYIVTDYDTGEEYFYDTYEEANDKLLNLQNG
tara:strand:+ start:5267 stop:5566 length:300 start_codon:yes stop_codon:yes gene_type:complete